MSRVGFVGLGNMGGPMAANLAAAGHEVLVFDLAADALERAQQAGCAGVADASAAIDGVDVFISMLPAGRHVESLYLGGNGDGLLASIATETLVIDCSTIDPATSKRVAAAAEARGVTMLDAPVSGGTAGAQNGTLTFIVGGSKQGLKRGQSYFDTMGANVFHAGDAGAGQTAKVCNNMLLAVLMAGTAEALSLGVRNGLDPSVLSEIMRRSSGGNWALEVYNPYPGVMDTAPASREYAGGFLVDLMTKDLGLAMDAAEASGASVPMGGLARNLFRIHAQNNAAGQLDFSSIQRLFEGK